MLFSNDEKHVEYHVIFTEVISFFKEEPLPERLHLPWSRECGTLATQSSVVYHIYPTPPLGQDMTHGQFLSGV